MPKKSNEEEEILKNLPKEAREKLDKIKKVVEDFKGKVLEKFEDYVMGISLLPPDPENKEKIRVFLLIDDSDSTKMTKEELKEKLEKIIGDTAKKVDPNLEPNVMLLTLLWQELYDGHYEVLKEIAISAPIYDKGMLAALRIAEVHKQMVIEKFEKYIVCYVLAGSLVQGKATPTSDIDVFIVVDDTDVKRMTRAELKDKLRAIIIGMGIEAGRLTGIENKLNIQVYILTDFWENIKEANPIIFTFLRDGVPLYDRGIFMAWKQLLKMGRIKPSPEAIDMYKNSGEQMLQRVEYKLREIATEDFFWATLTPTQAAIMLYGLPPPTPKETVEVIRDIFVKKEKMLEEEYVKILDKIIKTRKAIEHGEKKIITGREIDELLTSSKKYLERLKKLFKDIEEKKEKERIYNIYDT
ncbi:nucleotidyltransferase domain-containing protein, partial [Candidatus Woesearchaeota archaeon]|nr:nucleotidyltransferase domain-containing protein [Candidatus Woesearchaeota archaeon]